jgi:hypothetical protein
MDQAAGQRTTNRSPRKQKQLLRVSAALLSVCLAGVGLTLGVRQSHIRHQRQTDPEVATVWLLQTTHGPNHTLTRGSAVQRWANAHGIHALGDYQVLTSGFNGEPDGIEFWFDYESHLSARELECHRVGPTAFVDDLGQVYHGFLDFQGKTVGVYLPGYDHAAHRLTCTLHWMPRRPAAPFPVSRPMTFTLALPTLRRTLPPASTLPSDPVSVTKNGITVTIRDAHLSPLKLRPLYEGQRDLLFRLVIQGGEIADENVITAVEEAQNGSSALNGNTVFIQGQIRAANGRIFNTRVRSGNNIFMLGNGPSPESSFLITDPYGTALLSDASSIAMPPAKPRPGQKTAPFWTAPVNGAGRGTDAVLLHFHVQPPSASPKAMPPASIPFDIPVRINPAPTP